MWWLAACSPRTVVVRSPVDVEAAPTEVAQGEEEEEGSREARDEAFERRHVAPPGVDWRAVERGNAAAALARATLRRRARAAGPATFLERGSVDQAGSSWELVRGETSYWSGADTGGLWRATRGPGDRATDWTPVGDDLWGGVHHLVVLPARGGEPETVVATPVGAYLHRSEDGGATWTEPAGLAGLSEVRGMYADGADRVWLLADRGLLRSDDRGRSFSEVRAVQRGGDLWVDRTGGPGVVVATPDELSYAADGASFVDLGLPVQNADEVRVAASEATEPPTVYLATRRGYGGTWQLWARSGDTWLDRGTTGDLWWVITASIRDPRLVAYGGVNLHVSRDGGETFRAPNTWEEYYGDPAHKLHADIMSVSVQPDDDGGETWFAGTHGGPYRSRDQWESAENLGLHGVRVGQYYSVLTDRTAPDFVLVGAQDQGLQFGEIRDDSPLTAARFTQEVSGDYGHLVSLTAGSFDRVAMVYPGFVLVRSSSGPGRAGLPLRYGYPPGESPWWLPVLAAEPKGKNAFYFLGRSLWRYEARPDSVDYDVESWTDTDFRLGPYDLLSALAFHPFDPTLAWVVSTDGRIWRSEDGARSFRRADEGLPFGDYYYGTALVVARRGAYGSADPTLYVGGTSYEGAPVWRSTDGGRSFRPWSEGLPPTSVNTLVELRDGTGRLVAGTDTGVWMRAPDGDAWTDLSAGAGPIVQWYEAEVLPDEDTVRFATYGRGVWDVRFAEPGEGCFAARDDDGDGMPCDVDCDDGDPAFAPGVEDLVCDGVDHACAGTEGDADGDGRPDCGDCAPDDPTIYPYAPEVSCDDIDQDCDGRDRCGEGASTCGCAAPGAAGWPAPLALVPALVARRRRQATCSSRA